MTVSWMTVNLLCKRIASMGSWHRYLPIRITTYIHVGVCATHSHTHTHVIFRPHHLLFVSIFVFTLRGELRFYLLCVCARTRVWKIGLGVSGCVCVCAQWVLWALKRRLVSTYEEKNFMGSHFCWDEVSPGSQRVECFLNWKASSVYFHELSIS